MQQLSISMVAKQAGIKPSTIRYYEEIKLLPVAARQNGRRYYDQQIFERLAFIRTTQRLGFSLNEIQLLFQHEQQQAPLAGLWRQLAKQKLADLSQLLEQASHVQQLLQRGLRCRCATLETCVHCVLQHCQA